ncbi:MAG: hypothetical protein Q8R10_06470 [Pseudomonas sp.]|uniref:hypothetical protein n=1 Tax=Pseudomonas sp. TaxID=306 RepID=UPI0027367B7F|nr:hypothetical protein [Pseudomonas sp.]MDP3846055.1 hypothetical protein [Pseudomonas sp.]
MPSAAKLLGKPTALARGAYLLAVLIGSYGFIWTLTECAAGILLQLGLARSEAVIFSSLLGLVLYPVVALVAFAAPRPLRLWAALLVAGVLFKMLGRSWGAS